MGDGFIFEARVDSVHSALAAQRGACFSLCSVHHGMLFFVVQFFLLIAVRVGVLVGRGEFS
jgi:hypothetical protein